MDAASALSSAIRRSPRNAAHSACHSPAGRASCETAAVCTVASSPGARSPFAVSSTASTGLCLCGMADEPPVVPSTTSPISVRARNATSRPSLPSTAATTAADAAMRRIGLRSVCHDLPGSSQPEARRRARRARRGPGPPRCRRRRPACTGNAERRRSPRWPTSRRRAIRRRGRRRCSGRRAGRGCGRSRWSAPRPRRAPRARRRQSIRRARAAPSARLATSTSALSSTSWLVAPACTDGPEPGTTDSAMARSCDHERDDGNATGARALEQRIPVDGLGAERSRHDVEVAGPTGLRRPGAGLARRR